MNKFARAAVCVGTGLTYLMGHARFILDWVNLMKRFAYEQVEYLQELDDRTWLSERYADWKWVERALLGWEKELLTQLCRTSSEGEEARLLDLYLSLKAELGLSMRDFEPRR